MEKKLFPIQTETSCQLKWNWSTLFLNTGITRTCHRTSETALTPENFNNFHNTDVVIEDRKAMLAGKWPEKNCSHCKKIEDSGGTSDRQKSIDIPNMYSSVLDKDPTTLKLDPTQVEVYFSNACNLGCLYCPASVSSTNNAENKKFGEFKSNGIHLKFHEPHLKDLLPSFWQWFSTGFPKLKRLQVLGGEPFYQKEFLTLLEYIDNHPNPNCELNVVTNLMCSEEKLDFFIAKFKKLILDKKIKKVDITCSIDCWGKEQEFVRWGINLEHWEKNFVKLLNNKWIYLSINQTITVLTIKTMPALLLKLTEWNKIRTVRQELGTPSPGPSYMKAGIFGGEFWKTDFDKILSLMPTETDQHKITKKYMEGLVQEIFNNKRDDSEILKLITFLNEKDRRRGTNWKELFPWLEKELDHVV
jgi:hypothetical protein